jgi:hypothetical protein
LALKVATVGSKAEFVQIRLKMLWSEPVKGPAIKGFRVRDHGVQPFQMIGIVFDSPNQISLEIFSVLLFLVKP